ncbi:hypothetical protein GCM10009785_35150 [Brooklawnia cerclae]|uniref:Uncharacterized protein n=1 Tax=Brooklawnia cerclae TaxID=349934 RepID=A0ABX0SBF6_9ACTN|nr:hypothetical protein [Brooklawnia cerclae]NIH55360.1 hypothetical protein [Brooklawnia cerclae]
MSAQIKLVTEGEYRHTLAGPAEKLLMLTRRPPETDECAAAVHALESTIDDYLDALHKLQAVDDAERDYEAKIHEEAVAAVEDGRQPKAAKRPDFEDGRLKLGATRDALLAKAQRARAALDRQIDADSEAQGLKDGAAVPGLYEEAVGAVRAARAAFERLLAARDRAIDQLAGNPNYIVRNLPWHGPAAEAFEAAEAWITANEACFLDLTIDVREITPSLTVRRHMATAGQMDELYAIELREGFRITQHAKGHTPALIPSYYH